MDFGLPPATNWSEISSDPLVQASLSSVYNHPDDLDIWVGGLAEDHVPGAMVGEIYFTILKDQFERLRDGDRFWYKRYFPRYLVRMVERQKLSTIIRRNTRIKREIPRNVFIVP